MRIKTKKKGSAFTIVELVIVIGVIGILSAILIPTITNLVSKANEASTKSELTNSYKQYQVDVVDGYAGDPNETSSAQMSDVELKNLPIEQLFFSEYQNVDEARENCYQYINGEWVEGNPDKLLPAMGIYDYLALKFGKYYVFYEQANLTGFSLNKSSVNVKKGMGFQLKVIPEPETALVEGLTWESDNPNISVDEDGIVIASESGNAHITAKALVGDSEQNATCSVTVTNETITADEIEEVVPPAVVNEFKSRTNEANLDDPNEIIANNTVVNARKGLSTKGNKNKRNTYFRYDDAPAATYKVGVQNPFKFGFSGRIRIEDSELKSIAVFAGSISDGITLKYKNNDSWNDADGFAHYNGANREVIFDNKSGSIGKLFKLTVPYRNNRTYEFEFEAFDGYNVYNAKDLAMFDNRNLTKDKTWLEFSDSEFDSTKTNHFNLSHDPWHYIRNELPSGENGIVNGIALHNDIEINNSLFTYRDNEGHLKYNDNVYSDEQVEQYLSTSDGRADLEAWAVKEKENLENVYGRTIKYGFEEAKRDLIGSPRDNTGAIFYRDTDKDDDFRFEGNYFTIDYSKLKPIAAFMKGHNDPEVLISNHLKDVQKESHTGLFGFNSRNDKPQTGKESLYPNRGLTTVNEQNTTTKVGEYSFNNMTIKGNGALDNDLRHAGGLIAFKQCATVINNTNVISSDTYITYMTDVCYSVGAYNDGLKDVARNQVDSHPSVIRKSGKFNLEKCKGYNSFSMMFYLVTENNNISNSIFENAGGPLLMIDEVSKGVRNSWSGSPDYGRWSTASADCTNTYLENWVQGTEAWFELNHVSSQMPQFFGLANVLQAGADALNNNTDIQTLYPGHYKGVTKVEKNIPLLNMIALDVTMSAFPDSGTSAPFGNIRGGLGNKLNGHLSINDYRLDMDFDVGDNWYLSNAAGINDKKHVILETGSIDNASRGGIPNGHSAINMANNTWFTYEMNGENKEQKYFGVNASPLSSMAMAKGDYMSIYMQADAALYPIGIVFGMY